MIIQETYVDDNGMIRDNLCKTYSDLGVYIAPINNPDIHYESAIDPKKFIKRFNPKNVQRLIQRDYMETNIKIPIYDEEVNTIDG